MRTETTPTRTSPPGAVRTPPPVGSRYIHADAREDSLPSGPGENVHNGERDNGSRSRRRIWPVLVVVLVVLTFLGLPAARFLLRPEPQAAVEPPAPVVLGAAVRGSAERTARYTGNLTPESTTTVLPKVGGRITELRVRENQFIRADDVVAHIEDEVLRLQVEQARAAYQAADAQYRQAVRGVRSQELEIARAEGEQAEAALETARSNLDRTRRLYEAEAVSRREYEEARDGFQAAETQVANARRRLEIMEQGASGEELEVALANAEAAARQLELAELQLGYATVRAPVSGSIARVLVEEGQSVGRESPLVAIVNDRLIYAEIRVPERLYGSFRGRGGSMQVRVFPEAYAEREPFVGTVSSIASVINATSRTFDVEVAIPNSDGLLRPGMYVNAVFVLESYPEAVQVPDGAVYTRDGRDVVYGVRDGSAVEYAVTAEDLPGEVTIIHDGLPDGERIIVEGAAFVEDGDPVRVVAQP